MVWSKPALNWFKQLGQTVTHKSKWNQTMQNPDRTKNLINKLESYMSLSNLTPIGYPINSCSMCTFFDNMETQSRMFFFVVPSCWLFFYVITPIHWSCLRNEFCYFFLFFSMRLYWPHDLKLMFARLGRLTQALFLSFINFSFSFSSSSIGLVWNWASKFFVLCLLYLKLFCFHNMCCGFDISTRVYSNFL